MVLHSSGLKKARKTMKSEIAWNDITAWAEMPDVPDFREVQAE